MVVLGYSSHVTKIWFRDRAQEEELLYVLRKLLDLRLWSGSFWAAFSEDPSKNCVQQPSAHRNISSRSTLTPVLGIDSTLPAPALIADAVKRSPKAHLFHFYGILCDIASFPRKTPSAWIVPGGSPRKPDISTPEKAKNSSGPSPAGIIGTATSVNSTLRPVELDARGLAKACLKEIGKEMGAEI